MIAIYIGVCVFFTVKYSEGGVIGIVEEFAGENKPLTFLLMGVDQSAAKDGERQRSDVMMIVRIDPNEGELSVVGVPRDTMVKIGSNDYVERINHAYRYGGGELSLATLNTALGTDIRNYIVVDYNFVREMMKLVGGVKVDVPMDMTYDDPYADPPLHIDLKAGEQVLDEDTAIEFLRFRKGYNNQDLGRMQAQQQFIKSFISSAKKPLSIVKMPLAIKYFGENIETNMPLQRLIHAAIGYSIHAGEDISFSTLPGEPVTANGMSLYALNMEATDTLLMDRKIK